MSYQQWKRHSSSELIRQHLQAIHSARKRFIEAENSDEIRRAVRHKTRSYVEENYQNGGKVYFKRRKIKGWLGPGSVMGFDGFTVLVKLGGCAYKCHRCHVMKVKNVKCPVQEVQTKRYDTSDEVVQKSKIDSSMYIDVSSS